MISNELLEEVIHISNKNKYISKELLLKIVLDAIDKLDSSAKSKFNDVIFSKIGWNWSAAAWCNESGIMELNYRMIIRDCKHLGEGNFLTSNLIALIYPLHEIQHMNENYKLTTNSLESELLKLGTLECIYSLLEKKYGSKRVDKKYEKFLSDCVDIMPIEKIAEVDAHRMLLKSLDNYPVFYSKYKDSYDYMIYEYFGALIMGYNDNYSNMPVFDYLLRLQEIGYKVKLEDVKLLSKLNNDTSIEDKLKYGVKVSEEEVESLRQKILKI